MTVIKPFKGIRPVKEKAEQIASPPYDVIDREEAKAIGDKNELSFLHVVKPEIDVPDDVYEYDPQVINKGVENIHKLIGQGVLYQDADEYLYVYAQTMNGNTQYGIVACASVDDYLKDNIKKHELTRPDKEEGRKKHVRESNMNYEPVFFAYRAVNEIDQIVGEVIKNDPEYDFTDESGFGHHFWTIKDRDKINRIVELFKNEVPATYVADGHHRTAAAALVGEEKRENNPNHTGSEEYNYFLAVHFPENQLHILDYNRIVQDLNGLSKDEFIGKLEAHFDIENKGKEAYKPEKLHTFGLYIDGNWYKLTAKQGTFNDEDPLDALDVTVLSKYILDPVLDIKDLRKDKRIDFVGGIRGLGALEKKVDSGQWAAAFALYPVLIDQLIHIADTGNIMPPKTTWFEPKLKSGLIIHSLED
jgi:uncharacterized protein (DUF1015 family)